MRENDGGFGRRGRPLQGSPPPASISRGMPLLVKQVGGIALGAALAYALTEARFDSMKQVGKSLDRNFVQSATSGQPVAAIDRFGGDPLLQRVHRICEGSASGASLTEGQRADGLPMQLYAGESELLRAAAYVSCLAEEQSGRFCQEPHRQHLVEAVRQYVKLYRQTREEWRLRTGSPNGTLSGPASGRDLLSVTRLPSDRIDPQLVRNLRALARRGFIDGSDFGAFMGFGTPPELSEALKGVEVKSEACG